MSPKGKLVFDIETVGENFDALDEVTQENLTHWIRQEAESDEEYQTALAELKGRLGFSPLTGEVVVIGVLDVGRDQGVVYFQAPGEKHKEFSEKNIVFKQADEKEMLRKFWEGARQYDYFISFNGRGFDVPFLMIRSAVHGVRPTKDLLRNRYVQYHDPQAVHIDLQDQLSFYGAMRRKGSLHLWSRVFGIESPKAGGVTGDDVGKLFAEKKYLDIARYNVGDLIATKKLYEKWEEFLAF